MTDIVPKKRVACFIDGFNLYHAVDELTDRRTRKRMNHLKWLDLKRLAGCFIQPSIEEVTAVYYYSALATWLPDAQSRHEVYLKALESTGVTIRLGKFKKKDRRCNSCGVTWVGHEEKESDVNLALELLNESWRDSFDKAIIMTADTDLVPVIKMVRAQFAHKEIVAAIPEGRYGNALDLRHNSSLSQRIKQHHIEACLFGASFTAVDGSVHPRPHKYHPPRVAPGGRK
ncbi:NYN domain-containing protein [Chromobacterium sp. S0633]|uniref:NYN domain-containing protein n=1 Tax=Chromobacterium sp. S0633 TaxID=2957805 RepID=UPI0020A10A36|nr:NYN domain-containing protein [Chromobacterium sp. S0633]MCP1290895.1 NYN domain-containing protein [Chromobacterium sp. S0633]